MKFKKNDPASTKMQIAYFVLRKEIIKKKSIAAIT